ncbi:MAG: RDD family protein [Bacillota bacterium]|nr:RDD family protein [Bacillota bacterium]
MEDNNLEKEEQKLTKKEEVTGSETEEVTEEEVTEENVTENEEVKEAVEIGEAPKAKKEKKLGFFGFLFGNLIDLIAILFLSMIGLVLTGLILKALGYYVKENLTLYLIIVPVIGLLYSTIMETKLKATFGKKILGLKLTK